MINMTINGFRLFFSSNHIDNVHISSVFEHDYMYIKVSCVPETIHGCWCTSLDEWCLCGVSMQSTRLLNSNTGNTVFCKLYQALWFKLYQSCIDCKYLLFHSSIMNIEYIIYIIICALFIKISIIIFCFSLFYFLWLLTNDLQLWNKHFLYPGCWCFFFHHVHA